MQQPSLKLNDGHVIPQLGFGVFLAKNGGETCQAVTAALEAGYRHIDTAAVYGNESDVGEALAASGLKRDEVFVTTKLWNDDVRAGNTRKALETSLKLLKLDYVDLYLIHWPAEGYEKAWTEMVKLRDEGLIRSVGVSNFHIHHLEHLRTVSDVIPACDQVESHPYLGQIHLLDYCRLHGIVMEAWSPLGGAKSKGALLNDPLINSIAKRLNKSPAQVLIAWQLQRGVVVLPKSVHAERITANAQVFDIKFTDAELIALQNANRHQRFGSDPENFNF